MPSTYSTNLKIELMATGENSGTWGTVTNTNLGTAVEQAIVGYGNPDFTTDANLTITLSDSNSLQAARALVLNVTSTPSLSATRELIVPTIQKQYIVQNNTSGSQSITVKTSAGTGITVPNGRKAHLYVDGTNVIQMFDFVDINGGAIDGTTVGAASASTGAFTTLTASGATTLNGAVALGDAAADLITVPGTINSNVIFTDNTYDIGASGATRPRTIYAATSIFAPLMDATNLEVTNIKANDGTAAASIANSTGAITVSTLLNVDNLRLDGNTISSTDTNGNIIIAPNGTGQVQISNAALDLTTIEVTNIKAKDGTASITLADSTGVATFSANPILNAGTANGVVYLNASKVATSGSALTYSGNSLTSTVPSNASLQQGLSVTNATNADFNVRIANNLTDLQVSSATPLSFTLGASEQMRLNSSGLEVKQSQLIGYSSFAGIGSNGLAVLGNVGIGTNAPTKKLMVEQASIGEVARLVTTDGGSGSIIGTVSLGFAVFSGQTNPFASIEVAEDTTAGIGSYKSRMSFYTRSVDSDSAPAERVRLTNTGTLNIVGAGTAGSTQAISFNGSTPVDTLVTDSSGRVGIGTNSPTQKLTVKPSGTSNGILDVLTGSTNTDSIRLSGGGTVNTWLELRGYLGVKLFSDATNTVTVDASGNLGLGGTNNLTGSRLYVQQVGEAYTGGQSSYNSLFPAGYIQVLESRNVPSGTVGSSLLVFSNTNSNGNTQAYIGSTSGNSDNAASAMVFGRKTSSTVWSESMRLDASGRLGIGTTSPGVNLEIGSDTSTVRALSVRYSSVPAYLSNSFDGTLGLSTISTNTYNTSNGSSSWSAFQNTGYGSSAVQLAVSTSGADIRFLTAAAVNTNPTERARITSGGDLQIANGNLVMSTSGKGIDFSANTHAAGMTSELLDWFEEGNWTPTDDSGAGLTLTVQSAKYVRIGRTVFVQAYVIYPSTASGADAKLAGLPFTVATNIYAPFSSTSGSGTAISVQANSATSKMTIVSPSNYNTAITNSTLSNTGIIFSGHYTV